ncbi:hypothetical protein [Bradyrhizobium sp. CCBAU 51627]|uniref:hypothetical protein n=1 Tax=Bradyrhizobium sp. CCBAU 51627 TaxID=1325088 RepID=UPI0023054379|nr:hypothetical protein [Bradyrhizobium sp. CCBAU 51627]MDA9430541.1 hypothetical protein [Bradyrhizobium sp. CCBAU 51627]
MDHLIFSPQVALRGSRTYVHSTTLYEQLIRAATSLGLQIRGPLDMRVNRLIRKQPSLCFCEGPLGANYEEPAVVSFYVGETPWHCLVSERSERVTRSEVYDEESIRKNAIVEGQTIRLDGKVNASPFEVVTSLTLQLHNALLSIPPGRKWFLGRVQLQRLLVEEDAQKIRITLAKKTGLGLTRCAIEISTSAIGTIDFILGPST